MEFKPLFKKALEENTLERYDEVLKKAEGLPFEIYEHMLCKKAREKLLVKPEPKVEKALEQQPLAEKDPEPQPPIEKVEEQQPTEKVAEKPAVEQPVIEETKLEAPEPAPVPADDKEKEEIIGNIFGS